LLTRKFEEVAIAAGMAAIALITAANVVVRYLTNISFAFTEEYSVVLMVIVTVLGTSLAMAGGRHIKIEYFTGLLSARGQRIAEIVAMALVIVCFGIIAVYGAYLTWDEYRFESLTPGLGHPQWLHTGWLPLLSLFVIARAAGRAIRMARGEES
jgi:TRAP-type transport system small permease protein